LGQLLNLGLPEHRLKGLFVDQIIDQFSGDAFDQKELMMSSKNIFLCLAVVALVLIAVCTATQPSN